MAEIMMAVAGAGGRMGRMLVATVAGVAGCRLVAASETPGSEHVGRDAGDV
ncbi:MAG TPA: 4-hydroxy-tetrahydrodipicolinate reductase, partial [Magnetococcales bacterium]|nr:4-hydroxy-tetrahydrodipicolinate reductase [Magnetococcales bacterium]